MTISDSGASPIEDMLWSCVARTGRGGNGGQGDEIDISALLSLAASGRRLPGDAEMEKLERKATIARVLYARYARDWTPRKEYGKASAEALAGIAALFLLDASSATDRARSLKRLNAALWIMQTGEWRNDAPSANEVAAEAERQAIALAGALS